MNTETHTCVYCGAPATHQFKNGKWCCQESRTACPEMRRIRSEKAKIAHQKFKEKYGDARQQKGQFIEDRKYPIKYPSRGDHICVYCGGYAEYQLRDGRWCCKPSSNSCPINRAKNADGGKKNPRKGFRKGHLAWNYGLPAWNRGLTKDTDSRIAAYASRLSHRYQCGELVSGFKGKHVSEEVKQKLRVAQLSKTYQRVCKKTQPYVKKDGTVVNLDSSYERRVAKFLDEHDIEWSRPQPLIWIDHQGTRHHYFPDFYIPSKDLYLDPKNPYCFEAQKEKIEYVRRTYPNVLFLHEEDLSQERLASILL